MKQGQNVLSKRQRSSGKGGESDARNSCQDVRVQLGEGEGLRDGIKGRPKCDLRARRRVRSARCRCS